MRKLRFFLIGFVPGLLIVFFILNMKGAKCSGYLPDSRVRAETLTKKFEFSADFAREMSELGITEKFLRDSIFVKGTIDFDKSHPRATPCPDYVLAYPEKKPRFRITFKKCTETAHFDSLQKF